jgi:hypothetical protein
MGRLHSLVRIFIDSNTAWVVVITLEKKIKGVIKISVIKLTHIIKLAFKHFQDNYTLTFLPLLFLQCFN